MKETCEDVSKYVIPTPVLDFNFSTLMLFRCTKKRFAKDFSMGQIYFNIPDSWIKEEENGNKGQGDMLEGVFLSVGKNDSASFISTLKEDPSIEYFTYGDYTHFRHKDIRNLRVVCFYGLNDNAFQKEIADDGVAHYKFKVPKEYFRNFSKCKSRTEYDILDDDEKPAVIIINNPHEFFNRIRVSLKKLGIEDNEIIISPVSYLNRHSRLISAIEYPQELLLKDNSFSDQSEVRIIVNSKSPEFINYMLESKGILQIGDLTDITEIYDHYFDDMKIERVGNRRIMFSLPKSREFDIHDMDFFELQDHMINILSGYVQLINVPENKKTWQEKLEPVTNLMKEKYNVYVTIDENRNVSMYNLSKELLEEANARAKKSIAMQKFTDEIESLLQNRQFDTALNKCNEAFSNTDLTHIAHYFAGKIYAQQSDDEHAIQSYWHAYKNDCRSIESLNAIATIFFRRREFNNALVIYQMMQELKGYQPVIYGNMGVCYANLSQFQKAIECFDKGLAIDPNDSFSLFNKGAALYDLKDYVQSKECIEKALLLDPTNQNYKAGYNAYFN